MSVNPDPKLSPYPQLFPEADSNQSLYPTLPAPLPQATVPLSSQGNTLTSMNPKLPDTKKGGNFFSFVKNSLFSKQAK